MLWVTLEPNIESKRIDKHLSNEAVAFDSGSKVAVG